MSQLDGTRFSEGLKTPGTQNSPAPYKTSKAQNSPTNHHLQGDNISPSSQSSGSAKHHDYEGDYSPQKKSVFTKVKEKAKKLRHSLSNKKRHGHDNELPSDNSTPPWGVRLEDNDDHEEPEYLGAPIFVFAVYESEMAPETLKETAREHPREVHVSSEKHVAESSVKNDVKKEEPSQNPNKIINDTLSQKVAPVSEKMAPAHAGVPDATNSTASDIAGLTIDAPASKDPKNFVGTTFRPQLGHGQATSQHTWDKGVSVKEYLMQKLEPGEDERALSQVITETMSPRKFSGDQMGMVEKMKGAVNSFLQSENAESISLTKTTNSATNNPNSTNPNTLSNSSTTTIKTTPSSLDPVYTIEAKTSTQNSILDAAKTNSSSGTNTISGTVNTSSSSNVPSSTADIKPNSSSGTNTTSGTVNTNSSSNVPSSTADKKPSSYVPPISTNYQEVTEGENHGSILSAN